MSWREKNYDILPALSVRGRDLRRSLRLVTVAWMWGIVWSTAISGDQMRAFVRMIGFNDFAFGLMGAIPFLASFAQLPSAILVERIGFRKHMSLDAFMISRILWIIVAMVPLVIWPGSGGSQTAVVIVLVLMAVSYILNMAAVPLWWTWMGDLIPRRIRGRYLARRHQLTTLVQIIAILIISLIVQHFADPAMKGHENAAAQPELMRVLAVLIAVCSVFGVMDVVLFRGVRDVADTFADRLPPKSFDFRFNFPNRWTILSGLRFAGHWLVVVWSELFHEPMNNRLFRSYVGYGFIITFTATVGGWYYIKHASEVLHFSTIGVNIVFWVIGPISAILTAKMWGRLIDHWGRRPSLVLATVVTMVSALPWFFAMPGLVDMGFVADAVNAVSGVVGSIFGHSGYQLIDASQRPSIWPYALVSVAATLGGCGWSGVALAQSGVIMALCDAAKEKKNKYVAVSALIVNAGGVVGGLGGGVIAQAFSGSSWQAGPFVWNNYHLTFAAALLVRFVALALLRGMPDPQARPLRQLPLVAAQKLLRLIRAK